MELKKIIEIYQKKSLRVLGEKGFDKILSWSIPGSNQLAYRLSLKRLEKRIEAESNLSDILDTAFSFRGFGRYKTIQPSQVKSELYQLAELVKKNRPSVVMEIGTKKGGTFYVWSRFLQSVSKMISLDLPGGRFGGGYSKNHISFFNHFSSDKEMHFIRENSHLESTKREVLKVLGSDQIDFLFVDGDHTYEGIKKDFEMYEPLVAEGGIIAFHDICPHPPETDCEVNRFWDEIKEEHEYKEIVEDWDQGWAGIGLLLK